jgi:hypothetical protein
VISAFSGPTKKLARQNHTFYVSLSWAFQTSCHRTLRCTPFFILSHVLIAFRRQVTTKFLVTVFSKTSVQYLKSGHCNFLNTLFRFKHSISLELRNITSWYTPHNRIISNESKCGTAGQTHLGQTTLYRGAEMRNLQNVLRLSDRKYTGCFNPVQRRLKFEKKNRQFYYTRIFRLGCLMGVIWIITEGGGLFLPRYHTTFLLPLDILFFLILLFIFYQFLLSSSSTSTSTASLFFSYLLFLTFPCHYFL